MPVIVVGADHPMGRAIVAALGPRAGEVRVFVSDPSAAASFRREGVKVAIGDISDASHVSGASLNAFTAVLVAAAASDGREAAFASEPAGVYRAWVEGVREAGVHRLIWVEGPGIHPPEGLLAGAAPETAVVLTDGRSLEDAASEVARLDDRATLD